MSKTMWAMVVVLLLAATAAVTEFRMRRHASAPESSPAPAATPAAAPRVEPGDAPPARPVGPDERVG